MYVHQKGEHKERRVLAFCKTWWSCFCTSEVAAVGEGLSGNLMYLLSICEWNSNYVCDLMYFLSEFHVCFRTIISVSYEIVIMYVIWKCVQWKHDSCNPLIKIIWAHLKFLTCGTSVWYYDIRDKCKNSGK